AGYVASWNRADARALGGDFSSDGDLVIPTGELVSGPQAVTGFYTSVFNQGYRGSTAAATLDRVRFITPTVAILDGTWSITGAHDAQGRMQPPERGIYVAVATHTGHRWHIAALREQTSAQALRMGSPPRP